MKQYRVTIMANIIRALILSAGIMVYGLALAETRLDWLPPEGEAGLPRLTLDMRERIIPAIAILDTPMDTADMAAFDRVMTIDPAAFGIHSDGTHPVETARGINAALQQAKIEGANRIVFPPGRYLISETDPIIIDHRDTVIDLNGATLEINPNGLPDYAVMEIVQGAENVRITNGALVGDRDRHDYDAAPGTHEWGHGLSIVSGRRIEIDRLTMRHFTGDGAGTRSSGARDRPELLERILHSVYVRHLEPGAFAAGGAKVDHPEKTRSREPFDIRRAEGAFEFGYMAGYMGFPFVLDREYQAWFYDADMTFLEMQRCLQFRQVTVPEGAAWLHLEFNQPEVSDQPAHFGAPAGGWIGRITTFRPPTDVHFHHNILEHNRRLGLAFSGGRRWVIEHNVFRHNGGTPPAFGVDFEDGWEMMQDVVFRHNRFEGNAAGDLVVCAGSELLFEHNRFEKAVVLNGRPHNYIFRHNHFGGHVAYRTRTGVAEIHDNHYENGALAIDFDDKAVADGLYRLPGEAVPTPPLRLRNETLKNMQRVTGTYFVFEDSVLENVRFSAGPATRLAYFRNCDLDNVVLRHHEAGLALQVVVEDCRGHLTEEGPER